MSADHLLHIHRMKTLLSHIESGARKPVLALLRADEVVPAEGVHGPQILVAEIGPTAASRVLWALNTLVESPPAIMSIEFAHDERIAWLQCSHDGDWTELYPGSTSLRIERDGISFIATGGKHSVIGWHTQDSLDRVLASDEIAPGIHAGEAACRWLATDGYTEDEIADIARTQLAPAETYTKD